MDNTLTYILDLKGNIDEKLKQIGISSEQQLGAWAKVENHINNIGQKDARLDIRYMRFEYRLLYKPYGTEFCCR